MPFNIANDLLSLANRWSTNFQNGIASTDRCATLTSFKKLDEATLSNSNSSQSLLTSTSSTPLEFTYHSLPDSEPEDELNSLFANEESFSRNDPLRQAIREKNNFPGFVRANKEAPRHLDEERQVRKQGLFFSPLKKEQKEFSEINTAIKNLSPSLQSFDADPQIRKILDNLEKGVQTLAKESETVSRSFFQKEYKKGMDKNPSNAVYELTKAIGFKKAHANARELKKLSVDLIELIQQKIEIAEKNLHSIEDHRSQHSDLLNKLKALHTTFYMKSTYYLAQAAEAGIKADALYQKTHKYKHFEHVENIASVTEFSSTKIKGGVALPGTGPHVDVSAVIGGGLTHRKETKYNHYEQQWERMRQQTVSVLGELQGAIKGFLKLRGSGEIEVTGRRSEYLEYGGQDKGLNGLLAVDALNKNDRRVMSQYLSRNDQVQGFYRGARNMRNMAATFFGFDPKNPELPLYATEQLFAEARIVQPVLHEAYRTLGIQRRPLGKIDIDTLFRVPDTTAASPPETAKKMSNPLKTTTGKAQFTAEVGTNSFTDSLAHKMLPSVGIGAEAGINHTSMRFTGAALKPAHELLSVAHSRSVEKSRFLLNEIAQKVWLKKANGTENQLPAHLHSAYALIKNFNQHPQQIESKEEAIKQLTQASQALTALMQNFINFEKLAAQTYATTKLAKRNDFYKGNAVQTQQQLSHYQLPADRLSQKEHHTVTSIAEAVGHIWDSYSVALAGIELSSLTPILQRHGAVLRGTGPQGTTPFTAEENDLQKAIKDFSAHYAVVAKTISHPQSLPFIKESLYRHAAVSAKTECHRTCTTKTAALSGNIRVPSMLHEMKPGIPNHNGEVEFEFGSQTGLSKKINYESTTAEVHEVANPFRLGKFDTSKMIDQTIAISDSFYKTVEKGQLQGKNLSVPLMQAANLANALNLTEGDAITDKTVTRRNGEVQYVAYGVSHKKAISATLPNLLSTVSASLTANASASTTKNSTLLILGEEFGYHVISLPALKKHGIDSTALTQAKALLDPHSEGESAQPRKAFAKFFRTIAENKSALLTYFNRDSIGTILDNFSKMEHEAPAPKNPHGLFAFAGLDVFKKEITDEYFSRLQTSRYSTTKCAALLKNDPSNNLSERNIFKHIGVDPQTVKALLQQSMVSTADEPSAPGVNTRTPSSPPTIREFLANASTDERAQFFKEDPRGNKLLAAYVLLVEGANNIRKEFIDLSLTPAKLK